MAEHITDDRRVRDGRFDTYTHMNREWEVGKVYCNEDTRK